MLVTAALLVAATPGGAVRAAPASGDLKAVVGAIKRQFAKKGSVRFSNKERSKDFTLGSDVCATRGVYRFAAPGVSASDSTEHCRDDSSRFRMITIGRDSYTQSNRYSSLPKGKWSHRRDVDAFLRTDDLISGINPRFLELVASRGSVAADGGALDGVATTLHSGTVTVPEIGTKQTGTTFGLQEGRWTGGRITWRLWVGPDALPRRFHAVIVMGGSEDSGGSDREDEATQTSNTLYTRWGAPVRITPPSRSAVVEGP
ncbi:hypothetical protein GCM10017600_42120 [Streptosporangium carneum]|uniref:Uncharacterized protein n=1 Tax=Streptosporangium carneum TaxID=47481 RepID=A0A9W6I3M0_9ACTN|nr:hypothetical protein GCM10017600_42120 [Streptosporangium carneum]